MPITILFFAGDARTILRARTYSSRRAAAAAMRRARVRGEVCAFAGRRTATDPPTCHH